LTAILGSYAAKQCPVVAQNNVLCPEQVLPFPEAVQRRIAQGIVFEDEVLPPLRPAEDGEWVVIDKTAPTPARERATVRAIEDGARIIEGGVLPRDESGGRSGWPDLLVAHAGGYVPVDIKHHRTLSDDPEGAALVSGIEDPDPGKAREIDGFTLRRHRGDALQLAHYRRMLEAIGQASDSSWGGILGTDDVVSWYDLDAEIWTTPAKTNRKRARRTTMEIYDFEFGFRQDIVAAAQRHQEDPGGELLVEPMRSGECGACKYRGVCDPILEEGDGDASLLPGIQYQLWRAMRDQGIRSRSDVAQLHYPTALLVANGVDVIDWLARADGADPGIGVSELWPAATKQIELLESAGIRLTGDTRQLDPGTALLASGAAKAILEARAATGELHAYHRPGVESASVPRADVEVDVDMENTADGVYLWGCLLTDRTAGGRPAYVPFYSWAPMSAEEEMDVFARFWEWLSRIRKKANRAGKSFAAYVWYEGAENTQLRRITRGTKWEDDVESLITSEEWVDLHRVFSLQFVTGLSNSLKVVAPMSGHAWSVDDPGGDLSMVRYEEAVGGDDRLALEAQNWLLDYNRGDVEATRSIREWIDNESGGWPVVPTS